MRNAALPMNALVVGALLLLFVGLLCAPPEGLLLLRSFRFGIPAAAIVLLALSKSVPRWTFLHLLGDASYSIYLSRLLRSFGLYAAVAPTRIWYTGMHGAPIFYFLGTAFVIVVGIACWRYIERPLTLRSRIACRYDSLAVCARRLPSVAASLLICSTKAAIMPCGSTATAAHLIGAIGPMWMLPPDSTTPRSARLAKADNTNSTPSA